MKKIDLSELLDPKEFKQLQDLEESCGNNATKAALILCLTQIQELLEMDPAIVKNQITVRVNLALFHASTLPKL